MPLTDHFRSGIKYLGVDKSKTEEYLRQIQLKARDHARTPMQVSSCSNKRGDLQLTQRSARKWNTDDHAGFSTSIPWMRVNDDYTTWNAKSQITDPQSVYSHWRTLLKMRKSNLDVFVYGSFELFDRDKQAVFCYGRTHGSDRAIIVLNFTGRDVQWRIPSPLLDILTQQAPDLNNYCEFVQSSGDKLTLRPFEAAVWTKMRLDTRL